MQVDPSFLTYILAQLASDITAPNGNNTITFYATDGVTPLCSLPFDHLLPYAGAGVSSYRFYAADDTTTLRSNATGTGTVGSFKIQGKVGVGPLIVLLSGTVGGLRSIADITFNKTSWTSSTLITVTDLVLLFQQGS